MPIPLYGCQAHGGKIVSLDDPAVYRDLASVSGAGGSSYVGRLLSAPFTGHPSGMSKLRRVVQRIAHLSAVTLTIRAFKDSFDTGQVTTRTVALSDVPLVTAPFNATGNEFQLLVELADFTAEASFGGAEYWIVPRRQSR